MSKRFQSGHALIIGVGGDLPNTVNDAQGLAKILKDEGRCAYPAKQVEVLTGPAATRDAVLAALDQLTQRADDAATVIIYFSGHGYQVASSFSNAYFLLPHGYDVNRLKATAISGAEFAQKLRTIPAQKLLVLLDCCHAGGVGSAKAPGIELSKSPLPPEATELLAEGHGRVLIASSQEDELSFAGKLYSAFTLALIEALAGRGVAKQDGFVRVADLALHAREVVPGRTKDRQHPILHFEHADNFALAYYAGGKTQPKGLPFPTASVEIEPDPGAWQGKVNGSGAVAQGDHAVQARDVGGDIVTGSKTNIAGDVDGSVLSGNFNGPVAVGGGEAVSFDRSQGALYKPSGPVRQHFGDLIDVQGTGNIVGNGNTSINIEQSYSGEPSLEAFRQLLQELQSFLQTSGVDPDIAETALEDVRAVERQTDRETPNRAIILTKLNGVLGLLANADGVWGLTERLSPLVQQAMAWAKQLF